MRGEIHQRGSSWQVVVSAGFDPVTGKRVRIYSTALTREDAEKELTRLLRQKDTGTIADPGRLTFGGYIVDQWLPHQSSRVRVRTLDRYRSLLVTHAIPRIGAVKLAKLRPAHVQTMIDDLPVGAQTKVHVYRVVSEALRHAVRVHLLSSNPAEGASPPRPLRPSLTVPVAADVLRILGAADGWLKTALTLSASTGMRREEVLGLQWRSVDLQARAARLEQSLVNRGRELSFGPLKKDRQRRTISLPTATVAMLKALRKDQVERRLLLGEEWQRTDRVVERGDGRPIHPDLYSTRFARLAARVGLGAVRLHDLRHFYASELLRRGVHPKVVSEALGHASTAFTMDVYSHLLPTMGEQASAAIEAALTTP